MNRIFKRIWNARRGICVAVSEIARLGRKEGTKKAALVTALTALCVTTSGMAEAIASEAPSEWDGTFHSHNKWDGKNNYLYDLDNPDESFKWETGWTDSTSLVLGENQNLIIVEGPIAMTAGTFTNNGNLYSGTAGYTKTNTDGTAEERVSDSYFKISGARATFTNNGVITATGGSESSSYGFNVAGRATFTNTGTINAKGGPSAETHGFLLQNTRSTVTNFGTINMFGSTASKSYGFYMRSGAGFTNSGTINIFGGDVSRSFGLYIGAGTFTNTGVITVTGNKSYGLYATGSVKNKTGGTITSVAGDVHGYYGPLINESGGTITATGGSGESGAYGMYIASELTNSGTANLTGGSSAHCYGLYTDWFTNYGTINATGGRGERSYGLYQIRLLVNYGNITAKGGSGDKAYGYDYIASAAFSNHEEGTIVAIGGSNSSAHGFLFHGSDRNNGLTNDGTIIAIAGDGGSFGFYLESGDLTSNGTIETTGGKESGHGFYQYGGTLINAASGTITATGGRDKLSYGFSQYRGTSPGILTNAGIINLNSTFALNAFDGVITQTEETALISGNLLSFADVPISSSTKFAIGASDLSALLEAESDTKVSLAKFLTSSITGGTLHITDDDLNANSQQMIKDAIYGAGVGSPVNITFGGTGDRDICGAKKKVIDVAHVKAFLKTAGNEGSVLYQDDLNETTALSFGTGTNDLGSVGFRSVGSKSVSIAGGKELTLLGDGTKIAGDATGAVTVADGTLKLGLNHEKTISQKQGGLLGSVSVGAGGKVSIADVSGLFQIKDTLSLSETGRVQNDGTLSVGTLDVSGTRTSLLNNGTMTVAEVQAEGSDRSTIQNAGILAVDSSKNLSIQNKGTLVANAVQIGVTERIVNGGTLVTDSFVSDGAYAGRNEAQLVIGTTAKILYLKNNLDVAKALYEAGQTLPASVVTALKEAGLVTASASTNEVALMSLAQNDEDAQEVAHAPRRAMAPRAEAPRSETPNDAQEVRDETQDVGEAPQSEAQDVAQESHPEPQDVAEAPRADAPSAHEDEPREQERNENESDAHAPTRSIQDLIREANMRPRVGQSLVGALTVASEETASRTLASVESQAQDWTHGLWASADYVRSDFDAYENTRSGLLFGLQASGETYTIGGALIAGKGKAKTDNMASQNTKDIGGTLYVGLRFGNAHVSVAGLFSHHEGKVGDTKRTAKTYGSSVKVGVDSEFGGLTLTPYAGWRVIAVDHEDASDRTVTHQFPLGLKATGQFKVGGWQFKPTLDVSYIAQSGDKRVRTAGTGLESVIAGQYAVSYQAGLWAEKGNLSLGVTYRGTSGDNGTQGNGIQANLRYTF